MGLLAKASCQFAVKSGGHGILTGSSNIAKGVTIDLRGMRSVSLDKEKKTATVQTGAKWIDVYKYLDPLGYAIPGGRAGDVGVGGLTTGGMLNLENSCQDIDDDADNLLGGNSFFAARYGFACDNVKNFEVSLATKDVRVSSD